MNSRKNHVKRVAAGALAVLTVAAYAAPVANVGGLPSINALVAEAATGDKHDFNFDDLTSVILSIADTSGISYTNEQLVDNGLESVKLVEGKTATIKSQTPLTFTFDAQDATATDAVKSNKVVAGYKAVVTEAFTEGETEYEAGNEIAAGTTISSTNVAKCTFKQIALTSAKNSYSASGSTTAGYTYKFTVPSFELTATAEKTGITIYDDLNDELSTKKVESEAANVKVYVDDAEADEAYQNQPVTIVSDDCFTATVWDGNTKTGLKNYSANYCTDTTKPNLNGKYYVTFNACVAATTPTYAEGFEFGTYVLVNKTAPKLTYSLAESNTQLKATGSGIDAVIASLSATSYPYDTKNEEYPVVSEENNTKYALTTNSSAQKNKSLVTVNVNTVDEFLVEGTVNNAPVNGILKITFNGTELSTKDENTNPVICEANGDETDTTYADLLEAAKNGTLETFSFKTAGTYVVTYTVYTASSTGAISSKTLTYKFSIATLSKLTASNVKLEFDADNSSDGLTGDDGILVCDENGDPVPKLIDGVYTFEVKDCKKLDSKTVAVTAALYTDTKKTVLFGNEQITGSSKVSSINKTQTLNVVYDDPEYSSTEETIAVKWKVANAEKTVLVVNADTYKRADANDAFDIAEAKAEIEGEYKPADVGTSVDEISELEAKIKKGIYVVNGDMANISFEYVKGAGAVIDNSELDTHTAGLPSAKGDYSVFILYNGTIKNIVNVYIAEHSLYAAPTADQLTLTYGDSLFNEKNLGYVDYAGKTVKNPGVTDISIGVSKVHKLTKAEIKDIDEDGLYNGWEVYTINGDKYIATDELFFDENRTGAEIPPEGDEFDYDTRRYQDGDYLPASYVDSWSDNGDIIPGYYVVSVYNDGNAQVDKEGYELIEKDFVVTVAKKQITEDMILIDPKTWDGRTQTVDEEEDLHGADHKVEVTIEGTKQAYPVGLKLADGYTSGKDAKGYSVNVTVSDEETNYEGTVPVKWYIVKEGANLAGFDWNDDVTTIYDNGKIHFEFTRPANSNLDADVKEYGILVEKKGKIAAPVDNYEDYLEFNDYGENSENAAVQAAYTALQYGNEMVDSGQQSSTQAKQNGGQICGVNVSVVSANIGAWARPYLVLKDGSIHYGEVRYLNLNYEATDKLNLMITQIGGKDQVEQTANTRETVKEDLTAEQIKDKAAWRQDVKSGYNEKTGKYYVYAAYNLDENTNVKPNAVQAFGFVADKSGKIAAPVGTVDEIAEANANAAEKLVINAGYTEGRASKTSTKMDFDEVGANIKPVNSVTGVWVRSFVDFGNGLVVYTEPKYLVSVSDQYADFTPELNIEDEGSKNSFQVAALADIPEDENGEVTIKTAGVVIDNEGSFFKFDKNTNQYVVLENADPNTVLISENASKKNFIASGKAPVSGGVIFTGNLTPKQNSERVDIPVVARAFVVYTINGVDVTVYGEPIVKVGLENGTATWADYLED